MKGMQKIKRGKSFSGLTSYALNKNCSRIIGGNICGDDAPSLTKEFNISKYLRPDIIKPVWHNSLRLPKGERISDQKWIDLADDYMSRMGFTKEHQRLYVLHDEEEGQHIHIIASRISLSGEVYLGRNENLISTKHIKDLEKKHCLINTNQKSDTAIRRPSSGEVGLHLRTGEQPIRYQLAALIDLAIKNNPPINIFIERLRILNVEVTPNYSTSGVNGFSFSYKGLTFKGSNIGNNYTGKSLFKRGLTNDSYRSDKTSRAAKYCITANSRNPETGRTVITGIAEDDDGLDISRERTGHLERSSAHHHPSDFPHPETRKINSPISSKYGSPGEAHEGLTAAEVNTGKDSTRPGNPISGTEFTEPEPLHLCADNRSPRPDFEHDLNPNEHRHLEAQGHPYRRPAEAARSALRKLLEATATATRAELLAIGSSAEFRHIFQSALRGLNELRLSVIHGLPLPHKASGGARAPYPSPLPQESDLKAFEGLTEGPSLSEVYSAMEAANGGTREEPEDQGAGKRKIKRAGVSRLCTEITPAL
jgi:hypothetical protein